jgi:energy-coupling factor transporter transmembrane protein EcfT
MADLVPFAYMDGHSILHQLDVRVKLAVLCFLSMFLFESGVIPCFVYFFLLLFFLKKVGIGFLSLIKRLKLFFFLIFFIFLARAMSAEGAALFAFSGFVISLEGLQEGGLMAFKFFLIMISGILFAATTRTGSIKSAVQWFLRPVPFVPEKRLGIMFSLALNFIPVIFRQAQNLSDARKARCAYMRKNPVKNIINLVLPLLRKVFLYAEHLSFAMEARCYSDDRTDSEFKPSGKEFLFILGSSALIIGFVFL